MTIDGPMRVCETHLFDHHLLQRILYNLFINVKYPCTPIRRSHAAVSLPTNSARVFILTITVEREVWKHGELSSSMTSLSTSTRHFPSSQTTSSHNSRIHANTLIILLVHAQVGKFLRHDSSRPASRNNVVLVKIRFREATFALKKVFI